MTGKYCSWNLGLHNNVCSFHRRSKRKDELGWSNAGQSEGNVSSSGRILRWSCLHWPDHIGYAPSAFLWWYMATWMVPRHVLTEAGGICLSASNRPQIHVYIVDWDHAMSHELLLYCLSNQNKALKAKWVLSLLLQGFINTWCLYIVPFCHHKGPVIQRFDAFVDAINYFLHFSFCFILIIPRLIELCPLNSQSHPVSLWCWHLTCNLEKCYSLIIMISPRKKFFGIIWDGIFIWVQIEAVFNISKFSKWPLFWARNKLFYRELYRKLNIPER